MFTGFEILFLAFSGASAAGIASTGKVTRGAFAPTQYREYEEEPQVQLAHRQPQYQPSYGGGEVRVQRKGGHFFVQCMIADVAYIAMVDSGASTCVVSHKVMRELGANLSNLRWNSSYTIGGGQQMRAMTVPLDLTVMGIERPGVACAIMERDDKPSGPLANLIGMSFLSTLSSCEQRGNLLIMRP